MLVKTYTGIPRETVEAIFLNKQRAVLTDWTDLLVGDVLRLTSFDDASKLPPRECLRAVSHVLELPAGRLVSLRPLASFEKDAIK